MKQDRQTLQSVRDSLLLDAVRRSIKEYVVGHVTQGEDYRRTCASCGLMFKPRNRYHFLHGDSCRRAWYKGTFRPYPANWDNRISGRRAK